MSAFLWAVQGALAAIFLTSALLKVLQAPDALPEALSGYSMTSVLLIALAEAAGAAGVVLPAATGVASALTPLAAAGLAVIMVLAMRLHLRRREYLSVAVNVVLFAAAACVAVIGFGVYAVQT
ncbi:DoxX family protein [Nonomuraea sp. N2-4H]|uniref:DoxX family protein n=1 Tax=Nonomuraea sp. N2-4H TaxID=3128898 RepID=UPI0032543806